MKFLEGKEKEHDMAGPFLVLKKENHIKTDSFDIKAVSKCRKEHGNRKCHEQKLI